MQNSDGSDSVVNASDKKDTEHEGNKTEGGTLEKRGETGPRPPVSPPSNDKKPGWLPTWFKKNGRTSTDVGFRDDFTEVDEYRLPLWAKASHIFLTSFIIIIIGWACIAKIDKIVKAQGKFVTTGQEIVIRTLVDSIVESMDVHIGQVVKKGQKILTLDPTFTNSDLSQIKIKIENAKAIIYRIQCELNNETYKIPQEDPYGIQMLQYNIFKQRTSEFNSKLNSFDMQISSANEASRSASAQLVELNKQIEYADQIRKMRKEVFEAGYDTKLNLLQAENEYSTYKNQAEMLQKTIAESNYAKQQVESEKNVYINNWKKDLTTEQAQYKNELDTNMEQLSKAERLSQLVDITVPQECVVLEIGKISIGSIAKTGEALMTLIPLNEPIEAEVHIAPKDIGFIRQGDTCKIKIDAFPFQKHGGLAGVLKSIGEDTVYDEARRNEGPFYLGRITLKSEKLKNVPEDTRLMPGMSLAAEIVVGQRTVISYLLYPMISVFDESIREP
jgi:HlyD family secretion protein